MSYYTDAKYDAAETVLEFLDHAVEQYAEDGALSDDLLNDWPDGDRYHHESHVDKSYRLPEAAELLDELSEYTEDDSGLWEGVEPRRAIEIQAAFTYGNAVYGLFQRLLDEINHDLDLRDLQMKYAEAEDDSVGMPLYAQMRERIKELAKEFKQ